MGPEDARARVIEHWLKEREKNPPMMERPPVMDPPDVKPDEQPTGGQSADVNMMDDMNEDWVAVYKSTINGQLFSGCGCHGPAATNGWAHALLNGNDETLQEEPRRHRGTG